jgi:hypothetical protein
MMKSKFQLATWAAAIVAAVALAGCATSKNAEHSQHHPDSATAQPAATMEPGAPGAPMAMMDMKAMCDMHKKMMGAKTPNEQKAKMDESMKAMSPEMMQKHMAMMPEKCK